MEEVYFGRFLLKYVLPADMMQHRISLETISPICTGSLHNLGVSNKRKAKLHFRVQPRNMVQRIELKLITNIISNKTH